MTVFLVGSEELKARKQALIMAKQHQIVGRFMVEECHFHGIQSAKDISICLYNFDKPLMVNNNVTTILTKEYFPNAHADGKVMAHCADELMKEYLTVMKEIGIPSKSEIPMMYFINTMKNCFNIYGKYGKNIYFPDADVWRESIQNSGYIAAERIYYDVPIG